MTTSPTTQTIRSTPLLDSSDLLGQPEALRARAEEHGYLFFRNLLPPDAVLDVRRRLLEVVDRYGWLAGGHELMDGIADLAAYEREDQKERQSAVYADVQRVRQFHELAQHPRLLAVYRDLFEAPVFPHPRNIARVTISGEGSKPTPPHQDFIHIQGTPNVWTAWIPLGDYTREHGVLSVLDRSHQDGVLSYKEAAQGAPGGFEAYLCELDLCWAEGDFAAGDVLTFGSHTVHRASPNQHPEQVRLSCDFRYQPLNDEIHESSLKVHCDVLTWDEVYQDWPAGGIQWYWQDNPMRYSEWDEQLRWQKDKIC